MTNKIFDLTDPLKVAVPSGAVSGTPVLIGDMPGVCATDRDADGNAVVDFGGVYEIAVKGADGSGNAAISAYDTVYYDGGEINADDSNGTRYGVALSGVSSGATTVIRVRIG